MGVYLDNSSTTKVKDEIIDYAIDIMRNNWQNPNSTNYDEGLEARRIVENARSIIAKKIKLFIILSQENYSIFYQNWIYLAKCGRI